MTSHVTHVFDLAFLERHIRDLAYLEGNYLHLHLSEVDAVGAWPAGV